MPVRVANSRGTREQVQPLGLANRGRQDTGQTPLLSASHTPALALA
jgi:hypothetical protein